MTVPPEGICLPCEWVRARDGDTLIVRTRLLGEIAVRLLDCWAPEAATAEGRRATHVLEGLLEQHPDRPLRVWFPLPEGDGSLSLLDVLKQMISFDRILGRVFLGSMDLGEELVARGEATAAKALQNMTRHCTESQNTRTANMRSQSWQK